MCCRLREWVADAEIAECHDVIPSQPEQLEHRNDSGFCREAAPPPPGVVVHVGMS